MIGAHGPPEENMVKRIRNAAGLLFILACLAKVQVPLSAATECYAGVAGTGSTAGAAEANCAPLAAGNDCVDTCWICTGNDPDEGSGHCATAVTGGQGWISEVMCDCRG